MIFGESRLEFLGSSSVLSFHMHHQLIILLLRIESFLLVLKANASWPFVNNIQHASIKSTIETFCSSHNLHLVGQILACLVNVVLQFYHSVTSLISITLSINSVMLRYWQRHVLMKKKIKLNKD